MKSTVWGVLVAAIGTAVFLRGAVSNAVPSSTTSSTDAVQSVLTTSAPFAGQLLLLTALGALLYLAFRSV